MIKAITIGLFGVAGSNRGDDALALALADGFRSNLEHVRFVVPVHQLSALSAPDIVTFKLNRKSVFGIVNLIYNIQKCSVVVLGGGSLIQDRLGGSRFLGIMGYVWFVSRIARIFGKPLITAPIGVDELTTEDGKRAAVEILSSLDQLTVRDPFSANVAIGLLPDLSLSIAVDPAFAWPSGQVIPGSHYVLAPAYEGYKNEEITNLFCKIADDILENDPVSTVCLLAMDERMSEDAGHIGLIKDAVLQKNRNRVICTVPRSVDEAVTTLRSSRGVIGMRLHALILAASFVNTVCVSRTTKSKALMSDLDMRGVDLSAINPGNVEIVSSYLAKMVLSPESLVDSGLINERRRRLADYYRKSADYIKGRL